MSFSAHEGKAPFIEWLRHTEEEPRSFLDIGCGAGSLLEVFRPWWPKSHWTGVEVHEPFLERYSLRDRYDEVIVADVRHGWQMPDADVILLGDVLEHMGRDDALQVLAEALLTARLAVWMSTPIVPYPQGEMLGNPHEAHVDQWTHEEVCRVLHPTMAFQGEVVGSYWWSR